jgi:hypothetical protein
MRRYQIWDKQSDLYTPGVDPATGKQKWAAEEYIAAHAQWAAHPAAKVIITTGIINCGVFMEFGATVEHYKRAGAAIEDGMTDDEVLAAIEEFEDRPPPDTGPSYEERIAAALEFNNILQM